jgi:dihydroxyacetone kinase
MHSINLENFYYIMKIVSNTVISSEQYFCDLDAVCGDGDFGSTLSKGFVKIQEELQEHNAADIGALLKSCGMIMMENCGGATGSLWGSAFRAAGRYAKGKMSVNLKDCAGMLHAFIEGMQKVGKAEVGDKTLIDALAPSAESLDNDLSSGETDIAIAMVNAGQAATSGAEKTKTMAAKKGRATYLGDRSIGHPDAGAEAINILFRELNDQYFQHHTTDTNIVSGG